MAQRRSTQDIAARTLKAVARKEQKLDEKIAKLLEQKKQVALDELENQNLQAGYAFVKDLIKESTFALCGGITDAGTSIYPRYLHPSIKPSFETESHWEKGASRPVSRPRSDWSDEDFAFLRDEKTNYSLEAYHTLPMIATKVSDTITSFAGQEDKVLQAAEAAKGADAMEIVLQNNGITYRRVGSALLAQI